MSGYSDSQVPPQGTGQAYQPPVGQPSSQPDRTTHLPPPPAYASTPSTMNEQHAPPLPTRPASNVPQFEYTPPQSSPAGSQACPRCSYHNHALMTNCEVCEADLPGAMASQAPRFPPPPHSEAPHQPQSQPHTFGNVPSTTGFAPPPKRNSKTWGDDDPSDPIHYTRNPHKLVAYIIPLPTPTLKSAPTSEVPQRFLIYTPPPPPLKKPAIDSTQKEDKLHMVQRKWQDELRKAKSSEAPKGSWKSMHHKMVRGTNKAMSLTTSSNLDFLGRAGGSTPSPNRSRATTPERLHADDGVDVDKADDANHAVPVDEMIFIYPSSMGTDEAALREEFINTLMRTKSKAQRDSVIATGLVPVGFGIDFLLVVVGGLGEIATVWAFKSIMGAKTARSISKRLASAEHGNEQLKLTFKPSRRMEVMKEYLDADCHKVDSTLWPGYQTAPTEGQVIEAIGWSPHQSGGETRNWEDEQWELQEVKEDWKITMHKGAKEWKKECLGFEKEYEKAQKQRRNEEKFAQ